MATDFANIMFDNTTDQAFRDWGLRISQAFAQCGLVKHTDTGQIDWSGVTRGFSATAANPTDMIRGYEIWRFSDALQATRPVFIKIEYGYITDALVSSGNQTIPTIPSLWITVGTSTNGSGTLNGTIVSTRTRWTGGDQYAINTSSTTANTGAASASSPSYFSGDGSYIAACLGVTANAQPTYPSLVGAIHYAGMPSFFAIERSRNADGTANGDGLVFITARWHGYLNYSSNGFGYHASTYQVLSFTGGGNTVTAQMGYIAIAAPGSGFGTANFGGDVYFSPLVVATPKPQAQALCVLGTWKNDVPLASTQQVTVLGQTRTYLSLAGIGGTAAGSNDRSMYWSSIPNGALMMRYE